MWKIPFTIHISFLLHSSFLPLSFTVSFQTDKTEINNNVRRRTWKGSTLIATRLVTWQRHLLSEYDSKVKAQQQTISNISSRLSHLERWNATQNGRDKREWWNWNVIKSAIINQTLMSGWWFREWGRVKRIYNPQTFHSRMEKSYFNCLGSKVLIWIAYTNKNMLINPCNIVEVEKKSWMKEHWAEQLFNFWYRRWFVQLSVSTSDNPQEQQLRWWMLI